MFASRLLKSDPYFDPQDTISKKRDLTVDSYVGSFFSFKKSKELDSKKKEQHSSPNTSQHELFFIFNSKS